MAKRRITQHKRFVPNGTHLNSAFGGTSFMLKTLNLTPYNSTLKIYEKFTKRNEQL